jgi:phosphoribosylglycinamide formyltransferase 2
MSSSGKGQSVIHGSDDIAQAWHYAACSGRVDSGRVIVESFIDFDYEITLLTVRALNEQGDIHTFFCEPIGHRQVNGDYVESWQPHFMTTKAILKAKDIAKKITDELGGLGIFGVELFIKGDHVWFSEVSPRPHDTGLVTLATQRFSEFELHARAILGLPVDITFTEVGASAVIYGNCDGENVVFEGVEKVLSVSGTDIRLFGKPESFQKRRMGVVLATGESSDVARKKAVLAASYVKPIIVK